MTSHYDNAREGTVDPGVQHPGGGPAATGTAAGTTPQPPAPASAAPASRGSEPQAPHGDPLSPAAGSGNSESSQGDSLSPAAASGEPESPVTPTEPAGDPEAPAGPAAPAQEPGGTPPPAREPDQPEAPAGDPEAPVTPTSAGWDGADAAGATPGAGTEAPSPQTDAAREDHERQLEQLTARAEKADEYLELAKRTKADFENYRKRAAREAAAAQERGVAKLARELLPAVDNLDRAVAAVEFAGAADDDQPNGAATLISGIKLVHADVLAALQRAGIQRYSPKGERFDPQRHEAIAQQPVEGARPGTVVEVYQQGYVLGESVIRPARVVVAG